MKKLIVSLGYILAVVLLFEFIVFPIMTASVTILNILGVILVLAVGVSAIFFIEYLISEEKPIKKSKNKNKQNVRN